MTFPALSGLDMEERFEKFRDFKKSGLSKLDLRISHRLIKNDFYSDLTKFYESN